MDKGLKSFCTKPPTFQLHSFSPLSISLCNDVLEVLIVRDLELDIGTGIKEIFGDTALELLAGD